MRFLILLTLALTICSCRPKSAKAYNEEASEMEAANKLNEAIALHSKAIKLDTNYIASYIDRAVDKSILGDYKGAINDYNIVVRKSPGNILTLLNRGKNKHRLKDYTGAIEDFTEAINAEPIAPIITLTMRNDTAENVPSTEEIRLERGVSYYFLTDLNNSFKDLQYCINRSYKREIAWYWRGMIYVSTNNKELACKDFQWASDFGNKDADVEIEQHCR